MIRSWWPRCLFGFIFVSALSLAGCGGPNLQIALSTALEEGNYTALKELLARMPQGNQILPGGQTAMGRAASRGDTIQLTLLLQHGGSLEIQDLRGLPPLMYAANAGQRISVRWLLSRGVPPEPMPVGEMSPLARAVMSGDTGLAGDLIAAGADVERVIRRSPLTTVRQLARAFGREESLYASTDPNAPRLVDAALLGPGSLAP